MSSRAPAVVQDGKCPITCKLLPAFIVLMNFALVALFMGKVPLLNIVLRSVAEHERPVAVGLNSVVARTLGSIPGPILFGAIIDSTCLSWQKTCGVQGACWLYDTERLSWRLAVLSLTCNVLTVIFYSLALRFYQPARGSDAPIDGSEEGRIREMDTNQGVVDKSLDISRDPAPTRHHHLQVPSSK